MKLELGAGLRPTRGYSHHDAWKFSHIEYTGDPWMLDLPDGSVDEVLAVAFVEHLTFHQALDTFRNVHRMLKPEGLFLFDVPDYPTWAQMYLNSLAGRETPFSLDEIRATLFGWGRWPGDEHKFGWDQALVEQSLSDCGFYGCVDSVGGFQRRLHRDRFTQADNAHLYMVVTNGPAE